MGPYIRYRHSFTQIIRILIARKEGEPGNEATFGANNGKLASDIYSIVHAKINLTLQGQSAHVCLYSHVNLTHVCNYKKGGFT